MERQTGYRIQLTWDGIHFILYPRNLVTGQPEPPDETWPLPFPKHLATLALPTGPKTLSTYHLQPQELTALLVKTRLAYPLGRDTAWARALLHWILSLYEAGGWYPEVRDDHIQLQPLIDSLEAQEGYAGFREAIPPSLRAARPKVDPHQLWLEIFHSLVHALGLNLLQEKNFSLNPSSLSELPPEYQTLLSDVSCGLTTTSAKVNFFDPRQANLSPPDRASRLAFRLTSPTSAEGDWVVRPALEALAPPHDSCDALTAWQDPTTIPHHFLKPGKSPRLHLLCEFGRALRIFPDLGACLACSPPTELHYNKEQMTSFLKRDAEALRAYGYPLLGPAELTSPQAPQLTLTVDPPTGLEGLDIEALLSFQWNLALGKVSFDSDSLDIWAQQPSPLLFSQGRWFWIDQQATIKTLRQLRQQPQQGTLLEALSLAGGSEPLRLELADLLSPQRQGKRFAERVEPKGFHGKLRAYQRRGYSWLMFMNHLGLGACLADDMGLGKTAQALSLLLALKEDGKLCRALLVCPTSVLGNWKAEAQKFAPNLRVLIHHGSRSRKPEIFENLLAHHDLILTGYPLLTRDRKMLLPIAWDVVILDEAQQIKNASTQMAKVARELKSRSRILLTGTPIENRLEDLHSLFRFLQPELLGTQRSFAKRFSHPIEKEGHIEAKDQLKRLVGPFILRRTKLDPHIAPELPAKMESLITCSLTPEQAHLYQREVNCELAALRGLESSLRRGSILRLISRLKQLCDHPALLENPPQWEASRSGKVIRLFEILDELPQDEGVLIFSQFSKMLRNLQRLLAHRLNEEVLLFDGSSRRPQRDLIISRFQNPLGPRLLAISLKAGGLGINLTRATTVVHFDRWWNPAVENQATDRAFRLGQHRPVQVFKFSTEATLEEQIDRILSEKRALATNLIDEGDSWLGELDDCALSKLLLPQGALL